MKQYSHDYTLVQDAMERLYSATQLHANECYSEALERINEARTILQKYLAKDNMVEDNDVEDGWVKRNDVEEENEQRFQSLRDYIRFICEKENVDKQYNLVIDCIVLFAYNLLHNRKFRRIRDSAENIKPHEVLERMTKEAKEIEEMNKRLRAKKA